jgi:predicted RNase H-like HicB family nuclease
MIYSIVCERVDDPSLPDEYYYAHIPALDLTTHGLGIDGAKAAATDLLTLWLEEKRANGESVPLDLEVFFSKIEIDDAVQRS